MSVERDITFIVGCPRSGTTFLARLLRDYLGIGFVNELQIIPKFYKKLKKYSPLTDQKKLEKLIDDILKDSFFEIFKNTYSKYTGKYVEIAKKDILNNLPEYSYAGIIYAILKSAAKKIDKPKVGSKNPDSYLEIINELFPRAKVIHIIRDGRDCTLSFYRMRWGHTNAYMAAKTWKYHVSKNKFLGKSLIKDRYKEIKYEDLLKDPIEELKKLAIFLNTEIEWTKVEHSIKEITKSDNCYKWKKEMTKKDLRIFQTIAGDTLRECGYELVKFKPINLPFYLRIYYTGKDRLLREIRYRFRKDLLK